MYLILLISSYYQQIILYYNNNKNFNFQIIIFRVLFILKKQKN